MRRVLVLLALTGCAADVGPLELESVDAELVDDGPLEVRLDVAELDAGPDVVDAQVDAELVDDGPLEVRLDAELDTAPDVCLKKCLVEGGVPLGYFCSVGKDCCSGNCAPPDKRCEPPIDACSGCWSECCK